MSSNSLALFITASQTSIPLNTSSYAFPEQGGVVTIESETILYSAASENGLFGCTRGYNSTTPATHAAGKAVTFVSATPVRQNLAGAVQGVAGDPVVATDLVTLESQSTALAALPSATFLGNLASDPSSPTEGQIWYNTTSHVLKYRDNSTTQTVSHA